MIRQNDTPDGKEWCFWVSLADMIGITVAILFYKLMIYLFF